MLRILYKILEEQRKQTKILKSISNRFEDIDVQINNMDIASNSAKINKDSYYEISENLSHDHRNCISKEFWVNDDFEHTEQIAYFIEQAGGKKDAKLGKPGVPSWYRPEYIDWWFNINSKF